ncbi:MAG: aminoacyl-histidine dipeptidase [Candidatus Zixiibacteriota bacterium]
MMKISEPNIKKVLHWFKEISDIPRCSKEEEIICDYILDWANEYGFEAKEDSVRNIVIKVPGKGEAKDGPIVVLQGHVDMVCEKTPDSEHDFSQDPIKLIYGDDGWITANKTSLGADNGIAMAMAMAIALDENISHPPLELLFTVDEETGLTGANALRDDFIEGRFLINLDSEEEGIFTIGCAGGRDTHISLPLEYAELPPYQTFATKISVGGLKGGHSGMNINEGRANAIHLLARILKQLEINYKLMYFHGGTAHNAIPRDASATILINPDNLELIKNTLHNLNDLFIDEFKSIEPDIDISIEVIEANQEKVFSDASTERIIELLLALPHGVFSMSQDLHGVVETSNNLALAEIKDNILQILTSQRSSMRSILNFLTSKIEAIGRLSGAAVSSTQGYPSWKPDFKSKLLEKCHEAYEKQTGKKAETIVIHAGLECGVIGNKYKGMDMISIGPNIKYPHSPNEKMQIKSIGNVYNFLTLLLSRL